MTRRRIEAPGTVRAMRTTLVALARLSACATGGGPDSPRVEAGGEVLVGEWLDAQAGLSVFRGVPYAAPPVGALGYRPPAPETVQWPWPRDEEMLLALT